MKVEVKIKKELDEPYAVIYTNKITTEIQKIISSFDEQDKIITARDGEKINIIQREDIYG